MSTRLIEIGVGEKDAVPVWIDLRWDENDNKLYLRAVRLGLLDFNAHRYWIRLEESQDPLLGDTANDEDIRTVEAQLRAGVPKLQIAGNNSWGAWELVVDKKTLQHWQQYIAKYTDKRQRANEFLKVLNLSAYRQQGKRLKELERWEQGDKQKILGMYQDPLGALSDASRIQIFGQELFFIRETERSLRKEVMNEIEKWLHKHGYDEAREIGEFVGTGDERKQSDQASTRDQDDLIDKFRKKCIDLGLKKGKTIPPETLYEIARAIGIPSTPSRIDDFRDKNPSYHEARQYASLTGYKKRRQT